MVIATTLLVLLTAALQDSGSADDEWERQEPEFRRVARALFGGANPFLGQGVLLGLEARASSAELPDGERIDAQCRLGKHYLKLGEVDKGIVVLEEARALSESSGQRRPKTLDLLALAYLRKAEVENCITRHNAECCIFPLEGGALHEEREPAERARDLYLELLRLRPDDLGARWLLNVCAMALGEYPASLPEELRIPPEAFASEAELGRFRDVAPGLGVDTFNMCGGVVVEDFDLDGRLDILTSTYDPRGPLTLYRNLGAEGFEDRSRASRVADQLGGLNLVAGDYDGDGDTDVFVLRGAWLLDDGRIRNSLLRNDAGTFTDVTRAAGLADPRRPTQAATWGDFDGDGELDLFVGNESRVEVDPAGDYPAQLFRNQGDGTFEDVAERAGVLNDRYCKGVTAGDYDNDGDLDLYLSNVGPNRLYRNRGDGTFEDVAESAGVVEPARRSFACWFFDFQNDGWLDLFVGAYSGTIADVAADALGLPHQGLLPKLYANDGEGGFEDVTAEAGLEHVYLPMGANFGDVDQDGWLDVYLTTGQPALQSLMPNVMLRNESGLRFRDVTVAGGFGHLQKGHGVAFADLDHDGDQDLYHQLGGFFPGDRFHNALFANPGNGNRFLYLTLEGTKSNRGAVGARVRVDAYRELEDGREGELYTVVRDPFSIHRAVGSVSSFGGSPRRQEIGLGDAGGITRVEIRWPSGLIEVLEEPPLDAWLRVVEGQGDFERLELDPFPF